MNLKMYGKFVVWMLKKVFGNFGNQFSSTKKLIVTEPGLSVFVLLAGMVCASLGSAFMLLLLGKDISPDGSGQGAYILANGVILMFFLAAVVSVLYDKFLAEYEQTFTILKK